MSYKLAPALALCCALASVSRVAAADPATDPRSDDESQRHLGGQRSVGLGPTIGWGAGLGGRLGLTLDPVGLWVSGGYMPVFVFGNKRDPDRTATFDAYGTAQVEAMLAFTIIKPSPKIDAGLLAGYKYNSVLASGVGAGVFLELDLAKSMGIFFAVDYAVFPRAQDQLASVGYPNDRDPAIPWFQGGADVGLIFYP